MGSQSPPFCSVRRGKLRKKPRNGASSHYPSGYNTEFGSRIGTRMRLLLLLFERSNGSKNHFEFESIFEHMRVHPIWIFGIWNLPPGLWYFMFRN